MPLVQAPTQQKAFDAKKRNDVAYEQQIRVTGRVLLQETQQPAAGVWVMVRGAGLPISTEADGTFHVLLPDSLATQTFTLRTVHPRVSQH
jgi:hypothetical protein